MTEVMGQWWDKVMGPTDWITSFETLLHVAKDPFGNIMALVLLLSIGFVLVLLFAVVFLLAVFNADAANIAEAERVARQKVLDAELGLLSSEELSRRRWNRRTNRAIRVLATVVVCLLVWGSFGFSTQRSDMCMSCHNKENLHSKPFKNSAHKDADCSACHEGGSLLSRSIIATPKRLAHFISSVTTDGHPTTVFTPLPNNGCTSCHKDMQKTMLVNADGNKVKVAHKHPLDAGMSCIDCHAFANNAVSSIHDTGMQSCLSCHDNESQSAECVVCHIGDPTAPSTRKPSPENARTQVTRADCYACHNPQKCDSCHGVRMPHPQGPGGYLDFHAADAKKGYNRCFKCHDKGGCLDCHFDGGAPVLK